LVGRGETAEDGMKKILDPRFHDQVMKPIFVNPDGTYMILKFKTQQHAMTAIATINWKVCRYSFGFGGR